MSRKKHKPLPFRDLALGDENEFRLVGQLTQDGGRILRERDQRERDRAAAATNQGDMFTANPQPRSLKT